MIPSKEENPSGLHARYHITKADGTACDPSAVYFVLRLDNSGRDLAHAKACRKAALCYAKNAPPHLRELAADLVRLIEHFVEPKTQTTIDP